MLNKRKQIEILGRQTLNLRENTNTNIYSHHRPQPLVKGRLQFLEQCNDINENKNKSKRNKYDYVVAVSLALKALYTKKANFITVVCCLDAINNEKRNFDGYL